MRRASLTSALAAGIAGVAAIGAENVVEPYYRISGGEHWLPDAPDRLAESPHRGRPYSRQPNVRADRKARNKRAKQSRARNRR